MVWVTVTIVLINNQNSRYKSTHTCQSHSSIISFLMIAISDQYLRYKILKRAMIADVNKYLHYNCHHHLQNIIL